MLVIIMIMIGLCGDREERDCLESGGGAGADRGHLLHGDLLCHLVRPGVSPPLPLLSQQMHIHEEVAQHRRLPLHPPLLLRLPQDQVSFV